MKGRIAKADNPSVEIEAAIKCAEKNGYCWWGSAKNAVYADNIIIFQTKNSSGAFGVLYVSDIFEEENISDDDFKLHRPPEWRNSRRFGRYYKITGGIAKFIPREEILRENGSELRTTDLRTGVKVRI